MVLVLINCSYTRPKRYVYTMRRVSRLSQMNSTKSFYATYSNCRSLFHHFILSAVIQVLAWVAHKKSSMNVFFKTPWGQHSVDSASTVLSLAKCMQINLNSNSVYCGISHKNCSWPDDVRFVAVENELSTEELSSIAADCSSSPSSDAVLPAYWPMKLSTSSSSEMHILSSRNRTTRDN